MKPYEEYTHEQVHNLALDFQGGDSDAGLELANAFNGFLLKYVNLVNTGAFRLKDKTSRNFVGLYMKQPNMRNNRHAYTKIDGMVDYLRLTVENIRYIYSKISREELVQASMISLLQMAKRYNPQNDRHSFHLYVDRVYHYYFHNEIKIFINDPASLQTTLSFDEHDFMLIDHDSEHEYKKVINKVEYKNRVDNADGLLRMENDACPYDQTIFDINWINGLTCGPEFQDLSIFERRMVKMHYQDKMYDEAIANHFGMSRETITRKRNIAIKKIRR